MRNSENKLDQAISTKSAQRIYDTIGKRYDWFGGYEAHAKERSIELLELTTGIKLLEVGVGTGKQHLRLQEGLAPDGIAYGMDISRAMLKLTRQRSGAPLCQSDARSLPFPANSFDRLYTSYVLDLLPLAELPGILSEFHRVLKDDGRIVLVALTEGVSFSSRLLMSTWKTLYKISPIACAGCRPLQLTTLFEQAGYKKVLREVVVQLAMPSEIIHARK
jgi:ubiquinone/menaquinone biosynthesis C-methylase UbiE